MSKKRVLLISDSVPIKNLIEKTLEFYNISVYTLKSLKALKKQLKGYKPDLIVLDMDVENINCEEFCNIMSYDDILIEMPVILLAHSDNLSHIDKALNLCVYDYIYKPIEPTQLYERIKILFNMQEKVRKYIDGSKNKLFKATINTIHHELNQPLSVILLSIDLLESTMRNKLDETQKKYINKIKRSIMNINDIMYRANLVSEEKMEMDVIEIDAKDKIIKLPNSSENNTVFIIDDNQEIIETISDIIERENIKVITATSFSQAEQIIELEYDKIRTVLCDLKIGNKDGLELYHKIKKLNKNINFYLITGYPLDDEVLRKTIKELKIPILKKPFTQKRILHIIK